jgi:ATP-dependent Clp protease ATP-binding subunit ClpA
VGIPASEDKVRRSLPSPSLGLRARDEGSPYAEPEHLLMRICRDDRPLIARMLGPKEKRHGLEQRLGRRERPRRQKATAVDLPFSAESKRVLVWAAKEADRLGHRHLGVEHLLLGLMREKEETANVSVTRFDHPAGARLPIQRSRRQTDFRSTLSNEEHSGWAIKDVSGFSVPAAYFSVGQTKSTAMHT